MQARCLAASAGRDPGELSGAYSVDTHPQSLGELLVARGKLSLAGLDRATRLQSDSGERLEAILTKLGLFRSAIWPRPFSLHLGLPLVSPADFPERPILEQRLSRSS